MSRSFPSFQWTAKGPLFFQATEFQRHASWMPTVRKVALLLLASLAPVAVAADVASHKAGIWSLAPAQGMKRWVVIHNVDGGHASGVYHIEVIGRKKGEAAWQIHHLVRHMAITEQALQASVKAPMNSGGVYPETFDNAYAQWQKENGGKGGSICSTSVDDCM